MLNTSRSKIPLEWTFLLILIVLVCNKSSAEMPQKIIIITKEEKLQEPKRYNLNITNCSWMEQREVFGRVIGIQHEGNCFEAHNSRDCSGPFLTLKPGVPSTEDLARWNLNAKRPWIQNGVAAVTPCRDICDYNNTEFFEPDEGIKVSVYSEKDFNGTLENVSIKGCTLIPDVLQDKVASLKSNGLFCIELYDTETCIGESIQIPQDTPDQLTTDLEKWNFSNITVSVSQCGYNCPNYTLKFKNESRAKLRTHLPEGIAVTLYTKPNFKGKLMTFHLTEDECFNVTGEWGKPLYSKSIKTYGNCIDVFENDTESCDWDNRKYRRLNNTRGANDIIALGLTKGIHFIAPCSIIVATITAKLSVIEVEAETKVSESIPNTTEVSESTTNIAEVSESTTEQDIPKKNAISDIISQPVVIIISALAGSAILLMLGLFISILYFRSKQQQILTRSEYNEFKNGISETGKDNEIDIEETEEALLQPYDNRYEIRHASIKINAKKILGRGAFGVAFKGKLINHECVDEVAIKTTGQSSTPMSIKMLLSEIKIMIHVGTHSNVVSIIGACTVDAYAGKVLLVVELCDNGCLEKYLRNNFNNSVQYFDTRCSNEGTSQLPSDLMEQLIKWSYHIASGMEHISLKKITHADLATRNVLLTSELVAKITDFGLSRHIHEYKNYVKIDKSNPLPWRWMALESLKFLNFSTKSDVWAYGITLWEMFSLGTNPYPGMNWTTDFVLKLEEGMRLHKPPHAHFTIYETMSECWLSNPAARPSFTRLKNLFKDLLYKNISSVYASMDLISSKEMTNI